MWIAYVVIGVLILIFTVLWVLDPRDDRLSSEVRKIHYWVIKYKDQLEETDYQVLLKKTKDLFELVDNNKNASFLYFGRCCKSQLLNDYESLLNLHYRAYKTSINKSATRSEAYNALYDMSLKHFSMNDAVYYPKLNFHGIVTSINEDDTYTICDTVERCHRVKERDIIAKE